MKKLCIVVCLCTSFFAQAITKNDLGRAIRSLDVRSVEQIIEREKFTPKEYNQYLALAEEMVRSREIWILKADYHSDITTPSYKPSGLRVYLEGLGAFGGFYMAVQCGIRLPASRGVDEKVYRAGLVVGSVLVLKYLYDLGQCFSADCDQRERLRKKYDDAVTIKQLVYAADIVGV